MIILGPIIPANPIKGTAVYQSKELTNPIRLRLPLRHASAVVTGESGTESIQECKRGSASGLPTSLSLALYMDVPCEVFKYLSLVRGTLHRGYFKH